MLWIRECNKCNTQSAWDFICQVQKADLNKAMNKQCQHLNTKENEGLLNQINKYEDIFDGTLVTWNTTPVDLVLSYRLDSL